MSVPTLNQLTKLVQTICAKPLLEHQGIVPDQLKLSITGLPAGLRQSNCASRKTLLGQRISCQIVGRAKKAGHYTVTVSLTDGKATTKKDYALIILPNKVRNLLKVSRSRPSTQKQTRLADRTINLL